MVKRWGFDSGDGHTSIMSTEIASNAVFVLAADYDALAAELAAAKAASLDDMEHRKHYLTRVQALEAALVDMTADYHRWHDAYMALKYPDGGQGVPSVPETADWRCRCGVDNRGTASCGNCSQPRLTAETAVQPAKVGERKMRDPLDIDFDGDRGGVTK